MRDWNGRAETWLNGLRTWQFVLIWDAAGVTGVLLGDMIISQLLSGHLIELDVLSGSAVGSLFAATIFAFSARSRMQDKAKHGMPRPPIALK
jgi:hypothetical protein